MGRSSERPRLKISFRVSGTGFNLDLKTSTFSRKSALIVKFGQIGDVIMAIPGLIEVRVPQAKITTQVDDALTQTLKIRQTLLRHAVRQRQKEHITRFQLCDADEFETCLLAQIGVHVMQKFSLLAL